MYLSHYEQLKHHIMKYAIIILLLLTHCCSYCNSQSPLLYQISNNVDGAESISVGQFIITFENSSSHLEGEDIDKLLIVAYRALGSADQVVELSIANHRSALLKLHEILKTIQYHGVSTDQIRIKTINPIDANVDDVSLRIIAQAHSYANKHDLHSADFYSSY